MTAGTGTQTSTRVFTLEELLHNALTGRIRIPRFQRGSGWNRDHVIRLFDSVVRGYPIGILLLWKRAAPAEKLALGSVSIDAPESDDALWVLDGQQRIVSLLNVLTRRSRTDPKFDIGYDLRTDRVRALPRVEDPFVVPLDVLFELGRLLTWFAERPELIDHRDTAFDVAGALRQFTVPAYEMIQNDASVLLEILERTNVGGRLPSRAEMFSALTTGTGEDDGNRPTLARIASHVELTGFGLIDDETVFSCILAPRDAEIHLDVRSELLLSEGNQDDAFESGEAALTRAVQFVQQSGVPHITFLPYRYLLVVLTRFLALHPDLRAVETRLLRRWFWRAASTDPASTGDDVRTARIFCRQITPASAWASVRDLLDAVGDVPPPAPDLRGFRTNTPGGRITLCSLWDRRPRRPETGTELDVDDLANTLGRDSTADGAVSLVVAPRAVRPERRWWAANRVILPAPSDVDFSVGDLFRRRPRSVSVTVWEAVLHSHSIDSEMVDALRHREVDHFLDRRQEVLEGEARQFVRMRCEWGFESTPPLADLEMEDLTGDATS